MKTCLVCGTDCATDDPTCANCGEGSWSESVAVSKSQAKRQRAMKAVDAMVGEPDPVDEAEDTDHDESADVPESEAPDGEPAGPVSKKKRGR
jgi:hypothetical protein